nr:immunoglobulin light chain junction region [Macaca mulatta]
RTQVLEFPWTF